MKTIDTLIEDIYGLFGSQNVDLRNLSSFGQRFADILAERITRQRGEGALRMSNVGTPCERKLWYTVNAAELGEELDGQTRFKFLYGDILEELILFLAEVAGHEVTRRQEEVNVDGVVGHIDGFIDGVLVDCKSASPISFNKFNNHSLVGNDPFGYTSQLGGYAKGLNQDRAAFFAIDKVHGYLALDFHDFTDFPIAQIVRERKEMVSKNTPPPRKYMDEPSGKSGNRKLCMECSYCSFKSACWPGLRSFEYSGKVAHLTKVVREPKVNEA